ncbi:MAG: hypothetical protein AAFZ52_09115 [Bacteroidota bacterium]
MHDRILHHRFQDSLAGIPTLATIHFGVAILLLLPPSAGFLTWSRPQLCLAVSLLFFSLYWRYSWRNTRANIFILGVYLFTLMLEWQQFGFPIFPLKMAGNGVPKKGVMLDLFLYSLPTVYVFLRGLLVIPLGLVAYRHEVLLLTQLKEK